MNKIKVVWICHFSNKEVREMLPLINQSFANSIKNSLGNKTKSRYKDFAPWITNLIKEFEKIKDIELHVISPHSGLAKKTVEFKINGINYHFFKSDDLSILGKIKKKLNIKKDNDYTSNRKLIQQYISKIQPNIINLIGTENPYYSIASLDINDIPIYVAAQTVYTNPERKKHSFINEERWNLELKIHKKELYFGCGGRMHRDLILKNNPNAIIFKMSFPLEKPSQVKEVSKEFDFVFFAAGVNNKKGVEDAIEAFSIVKQKYPEVTLNIVGGCEENYKLELEEKIRTLNLGENVSFNGYFPIHSDMHQHIKKARFAVLPNKLDIISSTIIEAMLMELPVVTYKTSGSPYLNKNGQTVLLADIGDIEKLGENMQFLLKEPEFANQMKRQAKNFVEKEFNNTESAQRLVSNYKSVIEHHNNNIPIPKNQLFDPEEFPLY